MQDYSGIGADPTETGPDAPHPLDPNQLVLPCEWERIGNNHNDNNDDDNEDRIR